MAITATQKTKEVLVKTTSAGSSVSVQNIKALHDAAEIQARANAQKPIVGWHETILQTDPTNPSIKEHFLIALY